MRPTSENDDALQALTKQAAHEYIRERKAAIEQAALMLQRNEQREGVLALLEHLAQYDTITSVREKAQEVLNLHTPIKTQAAQVPISPPQVQDNRSTFGVRCKNGHVSYFDKRYVCKANNQVVRGPAQQLDELILSCTTCGETMIAHVDCQGYK